MNKIICLAAALLCLSAPAFAQTSAPIRGTCILGIGDGNPDAVSKCVHMTANSEGMTGLAFDYDLDDDGPMVIYGYYAESRRMFVVTHINVDIDDPSQKALAVTGTCLIQPYPFCQINIARKVVTVGLLAQD